MKIKVHNKELHTTIVYSAYHTGTWFNVNLLGTSKEGKSKLGRSDKWSRKYTGVVLESNKFQTKQELENLLEKAPQKFFSMNLLILQAHHVCGRHSPLLGSLQKNTLKIPIVIPVRDPLLSLNSLLWRKLQTKKKFIKFKRARLDLVEKHIKEIKDLVSLKSNAVIFSPIDLNLHNNKQHAYKILKHMKLTPSSKTNSFIEKWQPINTTPYYLSNQKKEYDNFFVDMKQTILNKDIKKATKFYQIELEKLNKDKKLIQIYKAFGYKNLLWF
jgi:hypothetical protein